MEDVVAEPFLYVIVFFAFIAFLSREIASDEALMAAGVSGQEREGGEVEVEVPERVPPLARRVTGA